MRQILLIDDDKINNLITKKKLNKVKIEVVVAESVKAGVTLLEQKQTFVAILLDLNMPEASGWDFLLDYQRLGCTIPIIIYTSSINQEDVVQANGLAMVKSYIAKPLNDTCIAQIEQVISQKPSLS